MANARKTLGSRAVGWGRVGGRRAAGAAQSYDFDVIFFITIIIYIFIYNLGVSAGAGRETWRGLGPVFGSVWCTLGFRWYS